MGTKKREIYEKIINIVLDTLIIIFGIILIVSIYNNIQVKILGNDYSSFFGYTTFEVQTGSMADTINPGDWIIVKKTSKIELNDIVTYSQDEDFITHRVVEKYKDTYITQGDANNSKDDAITKSQIIGKVVKILPGFGIIRKTFFNPIVLITLIVTLYSVGYILRSSSKKENTTNAKGINYKERLDDLINWSLTKLLEYIKNRVTDEKSKKPEKKKEENTLNTEELFETNDLKIEIPEIRKEDIDKTLYFRKITVDKTELDNVDSNIIIGKRPEIIEEEEEIKEADKSEVEEKINLIQNKKKKFKNIVEKSIYFKKEEINEIIDIILKNRKVKANEPSIKETLLNSYIDGKYYNYCGNINVEFNKKTLLSKMDNEIKKIGEEIISKYKGNDKKYPNKVNKYVDIFLVINKLEHVNVTTTELKEKRELYQKEISKIINNENETQDELKNTINEIIKIQKLYQSMIKYILDKTNTNTFKLVINKISGKKDMFAVALEHNITFSKIYSEYIVDKTYTEGIIAEDKVMVLLNMLLANIVKDMLDFEDNKKYFIHIPNSIYLKPNKLDKIFKMFEDEYAKNNIIVAVEYKDLKECSKQIISLRKKGYHFAIIINDETRIEDDKRKVLGAAEYIFIDKKVVSYNLISSIPSDLAKSIIKDNILNKLSSFGGE